MNSIQIRAQVLNQLEYCDHDTRQFYLNLLLKINLKYEILGFNLCIKHTDESLYCLITLNTLPKDNIDILDDDLVNKLGLNSEDIDGIIGITANYNASGDTLLLIIEIGI